MAKRYHRLLLLFVDGIGLATAGDDNPFTDTSAPAIEELVGAARDSLLRAGPDATGNVSRWRARGG